jgi:transcriptional regulator with XRE-family HTH domain
MTENNLLVAVGAAIRARRKAASMIQQQLASNAALHRTYLADVEAGRRNLSIITLTRIAAALGTTTSRLLAEAEAALPPGR